MGERGWFAERFELQGVAGGRLVPMEGLRGIAALMVFLVHFAFPLDGPHNGTALQYVAVQLQDLGNIGVDVFFVLSGFLIYGSLIERDATPRGFFRRRLERLYPTYAVVFVAAVYLHWGEFWPRHSPAVNLVLLGANALLILGVGPKKPILQVSWSLTLELIFYATIPWVIRRFGLRERTRRERIRFFVPSLVVFLVVPSLQRVAMFVVGIMLFEAFHEYRDQLVARAALVNRLGIAGGALCLVGCFFVRSDAFLGLVPRTLVLMVTVPPMLAAAFVTGGPVARGFSVRPLRWAGNMSYTYYLTHTVTIDLMRRYLGVPVVVDASHASYWGWALAMFAGTLVVSAVVYVAVEYPFSIERRFRLPLLSSYRPAVSTGMG